MARQLSFLMNWIRAVGNISMTVIVIGNNKDVNGHLAFGTRFPPTGAREFFAFIHKSLSMVT